ncbi:hypothetical protein EVAR_32841_1 [Eumeta japonica]|uniref:Reverse transcriptase domain-containing protein n=1 Tax=Eumeta variegata TaxID=151549 RepID=A0A4C1WD93_EUMVA|nr:hypothetical protein EVAR_32841_1 [Eumeta japonica]
MDYLTRDISYLLPWIMLYADNIVLAADTPKHLQKFLNMWTHVYEKYGLRICRSKTEYLKYPFSGNATRETINIGTTPIPTAGKFKYLSSMLTTDASIDMDEHRMDVVWRK